jgi:hypothetical protein
MTVEVLNIPLIERVTPQPNERDISCSVYDPTVHGNEAVSFCTSSTNGLNSSSSAAAVVVVRSGAGGISLHGFLITAFVAPPKVIDCPELHISGGADEASLLGENL